MNILLLQTDILWLKPEGNRQNAQRMIESSPEVDLIVLPEMFTTGFCMSPQEAAEKANSETLLWMQQMARKKNAAIAGSVATEDTGDYYNRFYFVKPDGSFETYDKRHLFTFAGEGQRYTAGDGRIVVEYRGVRILLQICYDLRFPVFARNTGDYDMILYVANWPIQRIEAWNTLIRARAIENQCYVAAVNRTGNDPDNEYSGGGTALIDFLGKTMVATGNGEEGVCGQIDMDALQAFRKKFPALADADQFRIINK